MYERSSRASSTPGGKSRKICAVESAQMRSPQRGGTAGDAGKRYSISASAKRIGADIGCDGKSGASWSKVRLYELAAPGGGAYFQAMPERQSVTAVGDVRLISRPGFWALVIGALAMILVFLNISNVFNEPAPSAASQIGEIAGEIKRSAWRSFFGLGDDAPAAAATPAAPDFLALAPPVLGVVAIVLSAISGVLGEPRRLVVYGTSLGAGAVLFHFFWWVALLIAGVVVIVAILENIGEIFSFW